jgi:hypothetical protein
MSDDIEKYKQLFKNIKESVKVARSKTDNPEILGILNEVEEKAKEAKL